ncbi:MAG TPA: hypothetical protein VE665_03460 [Hyphomicrobiaceae bacterium]|nr:hypothetical protein [Hyphomicrobiaceae bacterium]
MLKDIPHPSHQARPAAVLGAMLRGMIGFIVACFAAGAAMVSFVVTPAEIASADPDKLIGAGLLTLLTAIDSARFAALFGLIVALIGERRSIRSGNYYAVAGVAIALAGFLGQYATAARGQPSLVDNYALTAFLTAGFVGGFVYWLCAGRLAGAPATDARGPPQRGEGHDDPNA